MNVRARVAVRQQKQKSTNEDLAVISSHDSPFSYYKKVAPPTQKVHNILSESSGVLPSLYSPWSNLYDGGVLSGLALADHICSFAQVARVITEVNYQGHE